MTVGHWISPNGKIIDIQQKHIKDIVTHPDKFGMTKKFIDFMYQRYNEKVGQEGKARDHIMKILFDKGWIRTRKYKNFYSINVKEFDKNTRLILGDWANRLLNKGIHGFTEEDPYIPVRINTQDNKEEFSLASLAKFYYNDIIKEHKIFELTSIATYDIVNEILKYGVKYKYLKG